MERRGTGWYPAGAKIINRRALWIGVGAKARRELMPGVPPRQPRGLFALEKTMEVPCSDWEEKILQSVDGSFCGYAGRGRVVDGTGPKFAQRVHTGWVATEFLAKVDLEKAMAAA